MVTTQTGKEAVGQLLDSAMSSMKTGLGGKKEPKAPKEKTEEEKLLKEVQKDIKAFLAEHKELKRLFKASTQP